MNITNPRGGPSSPAKKGFIGWGTAYLVGGLIMAIIAYFAAVGIPLGR